MNPQPPDRDPKKPTALALACPYCGYRLNLAYQHLGLKGNCVSCRSEIMGVESSPGKFEAVGTKPKENTPILVETEILEAESKAPQLAPEPAPQTQSDFGFPKTSPSNTEPDKAKATAFGAPAPIQTSKPAQEPSPKPSPFEIPTGSNGTAAKELGNAFLALEEKQSASTDAPTNAASPFAAPTAAPPATGFAAPETKKPVTDTPSPFAIPRPKTETPSESSFRAPAPEVASTPDTASPFATPKPSVEAAVPFEKPAQPNDNLLLFDANSMVAADQNGFKPLDPNDISTVSQTPAPEPAAASADSVPAFTKPVEPVSQSPFSIGGESIAADTVKPSQPFGISSDSGKPAFAANQFGSPSSSPMKEADVSGSESGQPVMKTPFDQGPKTVDTGVSSQMATPAEVFPVNEPLIPAQSTPAPDPISFQNIKLKSTTSKRTLRTPSLLTVLFVGSILLGFSAYLWTPTDKKDEIRLKVASWLEPGAVAIEKLPFGLGDKILSPDVSNASAKQSNPNSIALPTKPEMKSSASSAPAEAP